MKRHACRVTTALGSEAIKAGRGCALETQRNLVVDGNSAGVCRARVALVIESSSAAVRERRTD